MISSGNRIFITDKLTLLFHKIATANILSGPGNTCPDLKTTEINLSPGKYPPFVYFLQFSGINTPNKQWYSPFCYEEQNILPIFVLDH